MKAANFYAGIAFGVVIVFLLFALSQIVPNITGYVTTMLSPEWNETWECTLWRTECGLVQDTRGVVLNNTLYTWESLGCPVVDCYKSVMTRTSVKPLNFTKQPTINQTA
jgi:hypothetical protein